MPPCWRCRRAVLLGPFWLCSPCSHRVSLWDVLAWMEARVVVSELRGRRAPRGRIVAGRVG
jgi:hypothetical protein